MSRRVRVEVCDHILRTAIRLRVRFGKVALSIVLHELLELANFAEDEAKSACFRVVPHSPRPRQNGVGLPRKIKRLQPAPCQQSRAIELPKVRLPSKLPAR